MHIDPFIVKEALLHSRFSPKIEQKFVKTAIPRFLEYLSVKFSPENSFENAVQQEEEHDNEEEEEKEEEEEEDDDDYDSYRDEEEEYEEEDDEEDLEIQETIEKKINKN